MNINESIFRLKLQLARQYPQSAQFAIRSREEIIRNIEVLTSEIVSSIARNAKPSLAISLLTFDNCVYSNDRELYYGNLDLFRTQIDVNSAVRDISCILETPSWDLGVLSTAIGMVAGPLVLKSKDGIINCNTPGGTLIPSNTQDFELVSAGAEWVLLVEKDATFQKILDSGGLSKLKECVFITGKGFPDFNTRLLVCKIWDALKIPILALVDGDPFGLEIMCVYRFGSVKSAAFSDHLACPAVRWLGIHPSDVTGLAVETSNLTPKDVRKLSSLMNRSYIKNNEKLRSEIQVIMDHKLKAEIEGISNVSGNYITDVYIPSKIHCGEYF